MMQIRHFRTETQKRWKVKYVYIFTTYLPYIYIYIPYDISSWTYQIYYIEINIFTYIFPVEWSHIK